MIPALPPYNLLHPISYGVFVLLKKWTIYLGIQVYVQCIFTTINIFLHNNENRRGYHIIHILFISIKNCYLGDYIECRLENNEKITLKVVLDIIVLATQKFYKIHCSNNLITQTNFHYLFLYLLHYYLYSLPQQ
jgi:hypothetical protein